MKTKLSRPLKPAQTKPSPPPIEVIDHGKATKQTRGSSVGFSSESGFPPYDRYPG
jgi:hypothetical protein